MADPRLKKKNAHTHTHIDRVTPLICHCALRLAPTRARRERIRLGSPFPVGLLRAMKLPGCHSNWPDRRTIGPITWHLSARCCCHRAQRRSVSHYTFSFRSSRKGLARRGVPRGTAVFRQATMWRSCTTKNRHDRHLSRRMTPQWKQPCSSVEEVDRECCVN